MNKLDDSQRELVETIIRETRIRTRKWCMLENEPNPKQREALSHNISSQDEMLGYMYKRLGIFQGEEFSE